MKENELENQSLRALEHDWKYLIPEQRRALAQYARRALFSINLLRAWYVVMAVLFSLVTPIPLPRRRPDQAHWM